MGFTQDISYYWTKNLDPRVADLPFVASSYQVPLIILMYLYFVLVCGPRFMKTRSPYSLKTFIKLYNIIQILLNVWLIYEHINSGLFSVRLVCPVFDYSYDYIPMRLSRCAWYFFLLKILDYVETGIFVLRKKDNQISALHLYHHVSTLLLTWMGVRYYAVAAMTLTSFINCFIHSAMYTYYFLAAWGPNVQKTVAPIKRWITITQMMQFVFLILYASQEFVLNCNSVDKWVAIIYIINIMINFYMFYNYYRKTYKLKVKKVQ